MAKLYNLARMTTPTTGTGTITLGSPVAGFISFAAGGLQDGDQVSYAITDGVSIEIGRGVYNIAGPTLSRLVLQSTAGNAPLNLSGSAEVYITDVSGGNSGTAISAGGDKVAAGAGVSIHIVSDLKLIGFSSVILLNHADGTDILEFPLTGEGLMSAVASAVSGDIIRVPSGTLTITDSPYTLTVPAGVEVTGTGYNTLLDMTIVNNGVLSNLKTTTVISGSGVQRLVSTPAGYIWNAVHTFSVGASIGAAYPLNFGPDVTLSRKAADVLQIGIGDEIQSSTFASGVTGWRIDADGSAEFANARIRGELSSTVFKYNEIQATAGTFGVFKSASTLSRDFTSPGSVGGSVHVFLKTSDAGGALVAVNDILRIKTWDGTNIRDMWLTVTAVATSAGESDCTCTLSSGSTSAAIKTGTAVVDYGPSGSGFLTLSADGAVGSSANLTIADHAGSPWSAMTLRVRLGNLNGSYGRISNLYGIGIGDYASGNYLSYDGTTGFTLKTGNGAVGFDENGISINNAAGGYGAQSSVNFKTSGTVYASIGSYWASGLSEQHLKIESYPPAGISYLDLICRDVSGTNTVELLSTVTQFSTPISVATITPGGGALRINALVGINAASGGSPLSFGSGSASEASRIAFYEGAGSQYFRGIGMTDASGGAYGVAIWAKSTAIAPTSSNPDFFVQDGGKIGVGTNAPAISDGIGIHIAGKILRLATAKTPASAGATGNVGEHCWDASYIYVCTATNTWKRAALSTW